MTNSGFIGGLLMFALNPLLNMIVLPVIGELRPDTETAQGARRLKLQQTSLKFFGEIWDSFNPAEKFGCLVITVVAFLVFFFKVVGDMLNKYPNNAYFNVAILLLYLSFDPMPHTTAYSSMKRGTGSMIKKMKAMLGMTVEEKKEVTKDLNKDFKDEKVGKGRDNKSPARKRVK